MTSTRVRLDPETRREQLLELGTRLLSTRSLDELSIDVLAEEAGVSRGLLYHYFGTKKDFHLAVVRRAVADLITITAPGDHADPVEQLSASVEAYLDYVQANYAGYLSLVRAAAGGEPEFRQVYEDARAHLTERLFDRAGTPALADWRVADSPATRLLAGGWTALTEELVISWVADPCGLTRDEVVSAAVAALPVLLRTPHDPGRACR